MKIAKEYKDRISKTYSKPLHYDILEIKGNELDVCLKKKRSLNDNLYLAEYLLKSIGYFQIFPKGLIPQIAAKLRVSYFSKGDIIMEHGTPGLECHIIY